MDAPDLLGASEIGDGPCNRSTRWKPRADRRMAAAASASSLRRLVRSRDTVEQFSVGFGIGAHARANVAVGLHLTRGGDTLRDVGAAFRRRRQGEVGGGNARTST